METIKKLADEITVALEQIMEIDVQFQSFLNRGARDVEAALLFSRFVELYYNRLETVFLHVKHTFGNDVDTEMWHKTLLYAMTRDTTHRRRLLSDATFHALDELRGFRHFVRYNYRLDNYDWDRITIITAMYNKSLSGVREDLANFIAYLNELQEVSKNDGD